MKAFLSSLCLLSLLISCSKNKSQTIKPEVTPLPTISNFFPDNAMIGNQITISGTNFGNSKNSTKVQFSNGVEVIPTSVNPTEIIFTMPSNGISGIISVVIDGKQAFSEKKFTFSDPNAYVVKTIGISRIRIGLDNQHKLTVAELFGGGNKVILKAGTEHKMAFFTVNEPTFNQTSNYPNARYEVKNTSIDNTFPPDTAHAVVIKLTGFDKGKTGYNQLNLVLCREVQLPNKEIPYFNLVYIDMETNPPGAESNNFVKQLLTGNINVVATDIAAPKNDQSYIIRDVIIHGATSAEDHKRHIVELTSSCFPNLDLTFVDMDDAKSEAVLNVGHQIRSELVNAEKGTMTVLDEEQVTFSNVKTGNLAQIVEPADSVDKVFLRLSGFNSAVCGYNEIRLFLTKTPLAQSGQLRLYQNLLPHRPLTVDYIKKTFETNHLKCVGLWMQ